VNGKLAVLLGLAASAPLAWGCGSLDEPPSVRLGAMPSCPDASVGCLNVGAETLDVAGVRVIYKQTKGQPLAALRILFDHGSRSAREVWAERLALTMLQAVGPSTRSPSDWQAKLDLLGAQVSVSHGRDYSALSATVAAPRALELMRLLREALRSPPRAQGQLDHFARVEQRNLQVRGDQPQLAAQDEAWDLLRAHTPSAELERLSVLGSLHSADLAAAFSRLLSKPRLTFVLVGDVAWQSARAELEQTLAMLPGTSPLPAVPAPPPAPPAAPSASSAVLPYPDAPTWHVTVLFRGPAAGSEDDAALRLGLSVLDARLYERIRNQRGLAYTVGARSYFYRETIGSLWLSTNDPAEALPLMRQIIADVRAAPASTAELAAARQILRTEVFEQSDTPAGLCGTLADWQLSAGDRTRVDAFLMQLEGLTAERVHRSLTTYLRGGFSAAAGGGADLGEAQLDALLPP
jgi:zinc protease